MHKLTVLILIALLFTPLASAETYTATLQFGGDVLIHQALLDDAYDADSDCYDFTHMLADVAPLLAETDLTVLNLEVPIAGKDYSGYPFFNSPPALLDAIASTGTDLLLCANNHAMDRLGDGARRTIEHIETAGLRHIGTARNREEFNTVPLFDVNGIQVAIFNYTQHTNGMESKDTDTGKRYAVHYFAVDRAQRDVQAAKDAGADFVILCVHWGKEYERIPNKTVQGWAQALCEAGADLVIGGHPHVLQPMETLAYSDVKTGDIHEMPIVYSTGNFLSGQREQYRDTGALFRFTLEKDDQTGETNIKSYGYIPTWVWLDDDVGRYAVLDLQQALAAPPEGMDESSYSRMQEAAQETITLLGGEHMLQTTPEAPPQDSFFIFSDH